MRSATVARARGMARREHQRGARARRPRRAPARRAPPRSSPGACCPRPAAGPRRARRRDPAPARAASGASSFRSPITRNARRARRRARRSARASPRCARRSPASRAQGAARQRTEQPVARVASGPRRAPRSAPPVSRAARPRRSRTATARSRSAPARAARTRAQRRSRRTTGDRAARAGTGCRGARGAARRGRSSVQVDATTAWPCLDQPVHQPRRRQDLADAGGVDPDAIPAPTRRRRRGARAARAASAGRARQRRRGERRGRAAAESTAALCRKTSNDHLRGDLRRAARGAASRQRLAHAARAAPRCLVARGPFEQRLHAHRRSAPGSRILLQKLRHHRLARRSGSASPGTRRARRRRSRKAVSRLLRAATTSGQPSSAASSVDVPGLQQRDVRRAQHALRVAVDDLEPEQRRQAARRAPPRSSASRSTDGARGSTKWMRGSRACSTRAISSWSGSTWRISPRAAARQQRHDARVRPAGRSARRAAVAVEARGLGQSLHQRMPDELDGHAGARVDLGLEREDHREPARRSARWCGCARGASPRPAARRSRAWGCPSRRARRANGRLKPDESTSTTRSGRARRSAPTMRRQARTTRGQIRAAARPARRPRPRADPRRSRRRPSRAPRRRCRGSACPVAACASSRTKSPA